MGKDFNLIEQEITAANFYIEAMDVHELCKNATNTFRENLKN
jgi:hypothetical protein